MWGLGAPTPHFSLDGHERGVNAIDYYPGGDRPYLLSGKEEKEAFFRSFFFCGGGGCGGGGAGASAGGSGGAGAGASAGGAGDGDGSGVLVLVRVCGCVLVLPWV